MNGYVIAEAIDKFTREYKKLINEKNQIEKDKLKLEKEKFELEKEKFEFNKKTLESNESMLNNESSSNEFTCPHNWVFDAVYDFPSDFSRKERHVCSICGEDKWITIESFI